MKNIIKLIPCLLLAFALCGCANVPKPVINAAYVQKKANRITSFTLLLVLNNNPHNQDLRDNLAKASAQLRFVTSQPTVSVNDLADIAKSIPVVSEKYGVYIVAGQMFLEEELDTLAVKNPELLRAAGIGMADAIDAALSGLAQ